MIWGGGGGDLQTAWAKRRQYHKIVNLLCLEKSYSACRYAAHTVPRLVRTDRPQRTMRTHATRMQDLWYRFRAVMKSSQPVDLFQSIGTKSSEWTGIAHSK